MSPPTPSSTRATTTSRSTQTDHSTAMSFTRQGPGSLADDNNYAEEPLGHTALDPYGRRSMAFRRKADGAIVTQTELDEAAIKDVPMRKFFRRYDAFMCFLLFEDVQWPVVHEVLVLLTMLFLMMPYLAWVNLMVRWDVWREGRGYGAWRDEREGKVKGEKEG